MKMVSVIIPAYNAEKYIAKCIQSVTSQSYKDVEIIVVNDGSADKTAEICENLAKNDDRINVVNQKNSGVSIARNVGLKKSNGEFVAFVDADDTLCENALENLFKAMTADIDFVIGSYNEVRGSSFNAVKYNISYINREEITSDIIDFDSKINTTWAKLYRKDIIFKNNVAFDSSLPYGEDHIFNLNYIKNIRKCAVISDEVYNYTLGGAASSIKFYLEKIAINIALMNGYIDYFGSCENIPKDFLKLKIKDQFIDCCTHFVVHCRRKKAIAGISDSLKAFDEYLNSKYIDSEHYSKNQIDAILDRNSKKLYWSIVKTRFVWVVGKKVQIFLAKR